MLRYMPFGTFIIYDGLLIEPVMNFVSDLFDFVISGISPNQFDQGACFLYNTC